MPFTGAANRLRTIYIVGGCKGRAQHAATKAGFLSVGRGIQPQQLLSSPQQPAPVAAHSIRLRKSVNARKLPSYNMDKSSQALATTWRLVGERRPAFVDFAGMAACSLLASSGSRATTQGMRLMHEATKSITGRTSNRPLIDCETDGPLSQ